MALDPQLVWFIDDEPYYTRAYRDSLQQAGYRVVYMESMTVAASALKHWPHDRPIAMIVDIQMPRPEEMTDGDMLEFKDSPGLWFILKRAAQAFEQESPPVMILTQRDPSAMGDLFKKIRDRGIKLCVHRKIETPAKHLPMLLKEFLESVS